MKEIEQLDFKLKQVLQKVETRQTKEKFPDILLADVCDTLRASRAFLDAVNMSFKHRDLIEKVFAADYKLARLLKLEIENNKLKEQNQ